MIAAVTGVVWALFSAVIVGAGLIIGAAAAVWIMYGAVQLTLKIKRSVRSFMWMRRQRRLNRRKA